MNTIINQKKKIGRQKSNIETLNVGIEKYKALDGTNAARIGTLEQTIGDLKKYNGEVFDQMKNLGISLRKLETAVRTKTTVKFHDVTNIKDTTIFKKDTTFIHISSYKDKWIEFYHSIQNHKTDSLNIVVRNDMSHFLTWDRKGFWPIRFLKRKKYFLHTHSKSPYIDVDSIQAINIVR